MQDERPLETPAKNAQQNLKSGKLRNLDVLN